MMSVHALAKLIVYPLLMRSFRARWSRTCEIRLAWCPNRATSRVIEI
jgi:hypothetical protein